MINKEKLNQQSANAIIHKALDIYETQNGGMKKVGQLRKCQASVYENERYIVLISYTTTVAFIDKKRRVAYDILRLVYGYTATSAQHIAKFFSDYAQDCARFRYYDV